ncbi:MAG: hypothetical protein V1898_00040 [Patescibacteria group bacterium]
MPLQIIKQYIFTISLIIILLLPVLSMAQTDDSILTLLKLKQEANSILQKEILPNLKVSAVQAGQEFDQINENGEVMVKTVNYTGLSTDSVEHLASIIFQGGSVSAQTPVIINIEPQTTHHQSIADDNSTWIIEVPLSSLAVGKNYAYVQTETQGVQSDKKLIATFNYIVENKISSKTWYFIIFVSLAIMVLLFAIILQLIKNARELKPGELI